MRMSVAVKRYQNFVDGKHVDSASGGTIDVINPATGEVIAGVPESTAEDIDAAVQAAEQAFAGDWGDTTPAERFEILNKLADALDEHAEELGELESLNVGKPREAAVEEIGASSDTLRFMAGAARLPEGQAAAEYVRGSTSMIRREPIGVVGQITPWNYPLVMVFDDADVAAVTETLKAASYWNAGQDCTAATRVVAGPKIYDDFMGELISQVESIKVGDPAEIEDIDMGPVVSQRQRERVMGFLERATAAGARVETGGETIGSRGFFIQPTIVSGADQKAEIIQKEVFGPVVTVQRFKDDAQAIEWANDVDYGLAASVWTESVKRGLSAVGKLQYGCVWLNDHFTVFNEMPHGGFKQSGYGKDMSKYGLDDYTIVKHVLAKFGD